LANDTNTFYVSDQLGLCSEEFEYHLQQEDVSAEIGTISTDSIGLVECGDGMILDSGLPIFENSNLSVGYIDASGGLTRLSAGETIIYPSSSQDTLNYGLVFTTALGCSDTTGTLSLVNGVVDFVLSGLAGPADVDCEDKDSVWVSIVDYDTKYDYALTSNALQLDSISTDSIQYQLNTATTITLSQTNELGCQQASSLEIQLINCELTPLLSLSEDSICSGEEITFTNISTGDFTNVELSWEIDGEVYEQNEFSVVPSGTGVLNGRLILTDTVTSNEVDTTFQFYVEEAIDTANFDLVLYVGDDPIDWVAQNNEVVTVCSSLDSTAFTSTSLYTLTWSDSTSYLANDTNTFYVSDELGLCSEEFEYYVEQQDVSAEISALSTDSVGLVDCGDSIFLDSDLAIFENSNLSVGFINSTGDLTSLEVGDTIIYPSSAQDTLDYGLVFTTALGCSDTTGTLSLVNGVADFVLSGLAGPTDVDCEDKDSVWVSIEDYDSKYDYSLVSNALQLDSISTDSIRYQLNTATTITLSQTNELGCQQYSSLEIELTDCVLEAVISASDDSVCVGTSVTFTNTSVSSSEHTVVTWMVDEESFQQDELIYTFEDSGSYSVSLTVEDTLLGVSSDTAVTVFVASAVSSGFDLNIYVNGEVTVWDEIYNEPVFICSELDSVVFSSGLGYAITWEDSSTYLASDTNKFTVVDKYELCDYENEYYTTKNDTSAIDTLFAAQIGEGARVDNAISLNGFGSIDQVLLEDNLNYGTAQVSLSGAALTVEYTANTDTAGVLDTVNVSLVDVCSDTLNVSFVYELENTPPDVVPLDSLLEYEVSTTKPRIIISRNELADDVNSNDRFIRLVDVYTFSGILTVQVDSTVDGVDTSLTVTLEEVPENQDSVIVRYIVCDQFNTSNATLQTCSDTNEIVVYIDNTISEVVVDEDGVITGATDKELFELYLENTAVTNNVGLMFDFLYNEEPLGEIENLQYELLILSRWGDIVYNETIEGNVVEWHGEYQYYNSDEKVPEGNYSFIIRAKYLNENGNERQLVFAGNLYYVNTYSVNTKDEE